MTRKYRSIKNYEKELTEHNRTGAQPDRNGKRVRLHIERNERFQNPIQSTPIQAYKGQAQRQTVKRRSCTTAIRTAIKQSVC